MKKGKCAYYWIELKYLIRNRDTRRQQRHKETAETQGNSRDTRRQQRHKETTETQGDNRAQEDNRAQGDNRDTKHSRDKKDNRDTKHSRDKKDNRDIINARDKKDTSQQTKFTLYTLVLRCVRERLLWISISQSTVHRPSSVRCVRRRSTRATTCADTWSPCTSTTLRNPTGAPSAPRGSRAPRTWRDTSTCTMVLSPIFVRFVERASKMGQIEGLI